MNTVKLGPFLGVNSRLPDFSLKVADKGDFVRAADNVDLRDDGTFVPRKGLTRIEAISGAHSLHGAHLVRASALYRVTLPAYSETLVKVLTSNARMSYVDVGSDTYFSNGEDSGRILDGVCYPIALPTPVPPTVHAVAGALAQGAYQVAVQYVNQTTGEEGGVSASTSFEVDGASGLRVTIPATVSGATHVNVYVSTVNGSIPLLQGTVAVGASLLDVSLIAIGREASQRYEAPLPAGRLFWFNGCLCSYKDNCVYEGLPFRPGYYLPSEGRIPFPAAVSNVVPAQNGVYVVSDKTYWLSGARMTTAEVVHDVLPYGGVYGTEFSVPHRALYGWFGEKGFVVASPDGTVEPVMADKVDVAPAASGFSLVLEDAGYRRVVSCGYCLNLENFGVTTYSDFALTSATATYATKADGIYKFDATSPVSWGIDFGKQNFGAENLKHMPACYLGGSSADSFSLRVQTPAHDYTYTARSSSTDLMVQRVDPGKGLRANWFNLSLSGESDFTLASVSFAPVASSRRI